MNNLELDYLIILKYPKVFGTPPFDPKISLMGDGFGCGKGWFKMLDSLFQEMNEIIEEEDLDIKVVQVKSKFSELRIYYEGNNDLINGLINEYERIAEKTCESCGKPGKINGNGMSVHIICDECLNKRKI